MSELAGSFDFSAWQSILDSVSVAGVHGVACPFGFELLRDLRFRRSSPRRLYVLGACPTDFVGDDDELARNLLDALLARASRVAPELEQSIALTRYNGSVTVPLRPAGYQCSDTDRLLSVQIRRTDQTVLADYASYLVALPGGVREKKIGELLRFRTEPRARRRLAQLLTMSENLVCRSLQAGIPRGEYNLDSPTEFQEFFEGHLQRPASRADLHFLERVVLPRFEELLEIVEHFDKVSDDRVTVTVRDFYGRDQLSITLGRHAKELMFREVTGSYRDFYAD